MWGFTVDQILTPKQSLHWSQWRNSFSNYSFDYNAAWLIAPNPLNSQKYEPRYGQRLPVELQRHASRLTW